ncbi:DddA-like double-stranded DNA deaminase toxin [Actinokineospora sp. NPDC004072]
MSLADAVAAIREGLAKVDAGRAALISAATLFDGARTTVQQVTRGSQRPEPGQAIAAHTTALNRIAEVLGQAAEVHRVFSDYLATVAGDTQPAQAPPRRPVPTPTSTGAPTPGRDRVEQLRRDLPPPIEGRRSGRKTHGRWFVGDRPAQSLVSGEDKVSDLAGSYLAQFGANLAAIRTHVEIKLAALIRQRHEHTGQTPRVTLVINNEICGGSASCQVYLPRLLPPGCSITVITPSYRQTFTGETM